MATIPLTPPPSPRPSAFALACAALRERGYVLSPCDIAGLTFVTGPGVAQELTIAQVVNLAERVRSG